jgi:hypothetical protein
LVEGTLRAPQESNLGTRKIRIQEPWKIGMLGFRKTRGVGGMCNVGVLGASTAWVGFAMSATTASPPSLSHGPIYESCVLIDSVWFPSWREQEALKHGRPVAANVRGTLADGLAVPMVGDEVTGARHSLLALSSATYLGAAY